MLSWWAWRTHDSRWQYIYIDLRRFVNKTSLVDNIGITPRPDNIVYVYTIIKLSIYNNI